ncbi:MAG: hypothetical protein M1817_005175 [Caeruleum heppii]|nr:MAG: hypothetical protein M1817_005175 [Caeruleum heppii]
MSSITSTYLLPAVFLNPVLLLHTFNTILSRLLPVTTTSSLLPGDTLPPSLPTWGPHPTAPHFDVHAHDNLCWSYTVFMVGVQLVAFGRVSGAREAGRERRRKEKLRKEEWQREQEQEQEVMAALAAETEDDYTEEETIP